MGRAETFVPTRLHHVRFSATRCSCKHAASNDEPAKGLSRRTGNKLDELKRVGTKPDAAKIEKPWSERGGWLVPEGGIVL